MIAHIVTSCASCPYAWIGRGNYPLWVCTAADPGRTIGLHMQRAEVPPEWCVLREADRLVTLRVR